MYALRSTAGVLSCRSCDVVEADDGPGRRVAREVDVDGAADVGGEGGADGAGGFGEGLDGVGHDGPGDVEGAGADFWRAAGVVSGSGVARVFGGPARRPRDVHIVVHIIFSAGFRLAAGYVGFWGLEF